MIRTITAVLLSVLLLACSDEPTGLPAGDELLKIPVSTESEAARDAYLKGRELVEALRYGDAAHWFEKAISEDPGFALAHLKRAMAAEDANKFFESLEAAEKHMQTASVGEQLMIKAFRAGSEGRREDQAQILKKLIALYPDDERAHLRLGIFHMAVRQYAEAEKHFGHAIQIAPDFAAAYNMLGYAHRGQGDFDEAKAVFERYVELLPDQANPYDSYAELLMEAGDYRDSIAMYRKALSIDPHFVASYRGIVINHSLLGEHEEAAQVAREMLRQARNGPEEYMARLAERVAYLYAGDLDRAIAVSREIGSRAKEENDLPRQAMAAELIGDVQVFRGESDAALRSFRTAYELLREAPISDGGKRKAKFQFLYKAALAALQSGDSLKAAKYLQQYEREIREGGSEYEKRRVYQLHGFADVLNRKYAEALENLNKADPNNPIVQYFMAVAYEGIGQPSRAMEHARQAAFRNTLDSRLAYFRQPAIALLERLDTEFAAQD